MNVILTVTDSKNQTASDSVQITVREPIECPLGSFYNSTSRQCELRFPDVIGNITKDTTPPVVTTPPNSLFNTDDPAGLNAYAS
jgi:hypothetical protein